LHTTDKKLIFLVFVFFFLINVISSGGHLDWWDGTEAFLVTESMVLKRTAMLDPTVPSVKDLGFNVNYTVYSNTVLQGGNTSNPSSVPLEPVYTVRSLLLSAVAVPFYYAAIAFSSSPDVVVGLFVNSLFISLTAVIIFCICNEVQKSKKIAFAIAVIYGVCSFVWPYNATFWVQPLQGLLLVSSTYFILLTSHRNHSYLCNYLLEGKRRSFLFAGLAGLSLGLSVFAHPTSLIFIPVFLVYSFFSVMRHQKMDFILLLVILGTVLFYAGLTNYARYHSFTEFGYGYYSSLAAHNGWKGLIGLLVSPGAGLIFYFPLALLLPLGAKYMYKENKSLFCLCLYIIVANWIYYGTLSFGFEPASWSGGIAWGPRYLLPVLPFMLIILGYIFRNIKKRIFLKSIVLGLCLAGFYVNLSGVLIWFQYGLMYGWAIEQLASYPNYMDRMTWYPIYSPIVLHTKALATDYVSTIHPEQYVNTSWNWAGYGNAPCKYDFYVYCNFGMIPFLATIVSIVILEMLIAHRIRVFPYPYERRFICVVYYRCILGALMSITRHRGGVHSGNQIWKNH
jgi:hypothetical protein